VANLKGLQTIISKFLPLLAHQPFAVLASRFQWQFRDVSAPVTPEPPIEEVVLPAIITIVS